METRNTRNKKVEIHIITHPWLKNIQKKYLPSTVAFHSLGEWRDGHIDVLQRYVP